MYLRHFKAEFVIPAWGVRLQEMVHPKGKALALVSDQSTHFDWCNCGHTKSPHNL
jgi:hypothetical protein